MTRGSRALAFVLLAAVPAASAPARTIVLTDLDTVKIAAIHADFPTSSWAGWDYGDGYFANANLSASRDSAVLIQFPLDRIPKGQRIVNAELTVPTVYAYIGAASQVMIWRLLAPWGVGVSHRYRQVRPEKAAWSVPGGRGSGVDRALAPTRTIKVSPGPYTLRCDVTSDVQLWYRGTAPNHGWIITMEEAIGPAAIVNPLTSPGTYALRITYEPE